MKQIIKEILRKIPVVFLIIRILPVYNVQAEAAQTRVSTAALANFVKTAEGTTEKTRGELSGNPTTKGRRTRLYAASFCACHR